MKRKLIGIATLTSLIVCIGLVVYGVPQYTSYSEPIHILYQDEDTGQAQVNIKAPSSVKVGDVIYIDLYESQGTGFDFEVDPAPPGLKTFDNGRIIICGTGSKNITYTFMISCALNGDSDIAIHRVKVLGAYEPVVPVNPGENLVEKVKNWAFDVDSPQKKEEAINLSRSFEDIASHIQEGLLTTLTEVTKGTKASNLNAVGDNLDYWTPLLNSLADELKAMRSINIITDADSLIPVWKEIAQGLKEYADTLD